MEVEILGCELIERKRRERQRHKELTAKWAIAGILGPFCLYVAAYLLAPGFITPFLNHPIARVVSVLVFGWNALGWFVFWCLPITSRAAHTMLLTLTILVCSVPCMLLPMVGPATIVIMETLGPVMCGR